MSLKGSSNWKEVVRSERCVDAKILGLEVEEGPGATDYGRLQSWKRPRTVLPGASRRSTLISAPGHPLWTPDSSTVR